MALVRKLIHSVSRKVSSSNKVTPIKSCETVTKQPLVINVLSTHNSSQSSDPVEQALALHKKLYKHLDDYVKTTSYSPKAIKPARSNTREGKLALAAIFDLEKIKIKYKPIKSKEHAIEFINEINDVYNAYLARINQINQFDAALKKWISSNDTKDLTRLVNAIEKMKKWQKEDGHEIRDQHVQRWAKLAAEYSKNLQGGDDEDSTAEDRRNFIIPRKPEILVALEKWIENTDDQVAFQNVINAINDWNNTHVKPFSLKNKSFDQSLELTKILRDDVIECEKVIGLITHPAQQKTLKR